MLVELAELQDREVGDGTTSVVIVAAELLKVRIPGSCTLMVVNVVFFSNDDDIVISHIFSSLQRANDLVRNKIHPTSIISGYRVSGNIFICSKS